MECQRVTLRASIFLAFGNIYTYKGEWRKNLIYHYCVIEYFPPLNLLYTHTGDEIFSRVYIAKGRTYIYSAAPGIYLYKKEFFLLICPASLLYSVFVSLYKHTQLREGGGGCNNCSSRGFPLSLYI